MDAPPIPAGLGDSAPPETEVECRDRLASEADGIAEARAELDAGLYVDIADVRAWVDSRHTETSLPLPQVRRS